ncbi:MULTISPECIES: lysozyme [Acinetobacter]|jgi:lysozyme|uniref:Lysozyme n=2 Tax=Acinetobacter calcoaceticus/baumannii complex TaxID=909768 RepID=A0A8B4M5Z7_ACIBA|nr:MULTISPECIES: lysozyme [Acinetobacter]CAH1073581.1 Gifsy-2 prophage lysozyme [Acinetobacter phage MD-2021a]ARG33970.1 muraminidase [Acinetobacter baumannii]EKU7213473.1 lysozyme [Acinetobacter baumannii]EKW1053979.1 lysozyme [Acinetobacter baumannii]EKW6911614.1 lysozyme [Acinetobacter baumannii]
MSKTTSNAGLNLIKGFEGKRLNAYDDGVGVWTIGFGTIKYPNGVRVKKGDTCTEQQAETYLKNDLTKFEVAINKLVKVPLTQNQFDALASFTYNLGETNLANSTLLKKLNKSDYQGAADQFLVWNKAGGKVMKGLVRRREAERALFLKK